MSESLGLLSKQYLSKLITRLDDLPMQFLGSQCAKEVFYMRASLL